MTHAMTPDRMRGRLAIQTVARAACAMALLATSACGGAATAATQDPAPRTGPATSSAAVGGDTTTASFLVPVGYGTLRQEDIAVQLQLTGVQMRAIPLDESVIRVLKPDSYRNLRVLQETKQTDVAALTRRYGVPRFSLWYVTYYGMAQEARFSPQEFAIVSNGREYRPLDVVPLTNGFGENRLRLRETQSAIYLFDGALDVNQPLTLRVQGTESDSWQETLRRVERERSLVRSRANGAGSPGR
jgi:hypothetical protein